MRPNRVKENKGEFRGSISKFIRSYMLLILSGGTMNQAHKFHRMV